MIRKSFTQKAWYAPLFQHRNWKHLQDVNGCVREGQRNGTNLRWIAYFPVYRLFLMVFIVSPLCGTDKCTAKISIFRIIAKPAYLVWNCAPSAEAACNPAHDFFFVQEIKIIRRLEMRRKVLLIGCMKHWWKWWSQGYSSVKRPGDACRSCEKQNQTPEMPEISKLYGHLIYNVFYNFRWRKSADLRSFLRRYGDRKNMIKILFICHGRICWSW